MLTPKQLAVALLPPEGTLPFVVTLTSHYSFLFHSNALFPLFSCDLSRSSSSFIVQILRLVVIVITLRTAFLLHTSQDVFILPLFLLR